VTFPYAVQPESCLSDCVCSTAVLVLEVSRRAWGLRLRRTKLVLALSRPLMLPSAHYKGVGVRIASFRSCIPIPPIPCLRFAVSLAVTAQDSGPSGSLLLSREALSSSTSSRFIPAHRNGVLSPITKSVPVFAQPTIQKRVSLSSSCKPRACDTTLRPAGSKAPRCWRFQLPFAAAVGAYQDRPADRVRG
jgi:hypothetical protein